MPIPRMNTPCFSLGSAATVFRISMTVFWYPSPNVSEYPGDSNLTVGMCEFSLVRSSPIRDAPGLLMIPMSPGESCTVMSYSSCRRSDAPLTKVSPSRYVQGMRGW